METLRTTGTLTLAAKEGRKPTLFIEAYNGGELSINGQKYIVDLGTLKLPRNVTFLADHENKLSGVAGSGTATTDGKRLTASGVLAPDSPAAQAIIGLAKAGVALQASVGVSFDRAGTQHVRAGAELKANGRTFKGDDGITFVRNGLLKEISIVAFGADSSTSVTVAAQHRGNMDTSNDNGQETADTTTNAGDDVSRLKAIRECCMVAEVENGRRVMKHYSNIEAQAIEQGWDANRTALEVLRASRPQMSNVGIRTTTRTAPTRSILAAAVMLHAGRGDLAENTYGENVAQQAEELRCNSLVDLCAASLRADHLDIPRDRNEMIRAAFSTASLPVALSAYAEKSAAEAFAETPSIWRQLCRRRHVNTFHEHKISRVLLVGNLQALGATGEIKHGTRTETTKTVQAGTKALMLGIDRTHIVNDDLQTFTDTATALAMAGARTMNDDFVNTILSNAGDFFHGDNGNLGTTGTALSATTLAAAIASMAKRTDAEGRIIDVRAKYLLVPPELEYAADQLLASAEVQRYTSASADNRPTGNPLRQALDRLSEPRLSSTAYTGYSATAWYLFASAQAGAINVALLNGRDTPVIESADVDFNRLGLQWRTYVDYGFALGEPAAAHKATGQS